ncbi:MAG: class I SAM-dependent methyltransferase [Actinobacteria bacterium]|nr:MAG: class I SAM-dependent methyltransferase [Actinomycetota bacterium]
MRAGEIRLLAGQAGIAPGVSVLDLCCGVAGPGRFITRELGCTYLGVDYSSSALDIARERAGDLPCRFAVSRIPPVPAGPFDVVLLLETMLAFPDKETLLEEISQALTTGGRFAFTMEEGLPLTEAERQRMPDSDTVWLTPLQEMLTWLDSVGLVVGKDAVVPACRDAQYPTQRAPLGVRQSASASADRSDGRLPPYCGPLVCAGPPLIDSEKTGWISCQECWVSFTQAPTSATRSPTAGLGRWPPSRGVSSTTSQPCWAARLPLLRSRR